MEDPAAWSGAPNLDPKVVAAISSIPLELTDVALDLLNAVIAICGPRSPVIGEAAFVLTSPNFRPVLEAEARLKGLFPTTSSLQARQSSCPSSSSPNTTPSR
ncbi:hypothetical protein [Azospirillum agricola]|uniref:hypothetical protein n=1 Tax=Azospirillum agricola TaxID=1720247 RepID=UPI0011789FFE|nr:hypothetical protein [Azospirillum agricola]